VNCPSSCHGGTIIIPILYSIFRYPRFFIANDSILIWSIGNMILSSQGYWCENSIPAREGLDSPDFLTEIAGIIRGQWGYACQWLSCWEKQLGNLQCLSPKHEGFLQMFASTNSGPATIQGFGSNFFFFCWNLVLFLITRYDIVSKPCTTGEHQNSW
jgi:hypothetical protein